jgi:hypothetical protein
MARNAMKQEHPRRVHRGRRPVTRKDLRPIKPAMGSQPPRRRPGNRGRAARPDLEVAHPEPELHADGHVQEDERTLNRPSQGLAAVEGGRAPASSVPCCEQGSPP